MPPEPHGFSHLTNKIYLYRCGTEPNHKKGLWRLLTPESTMACVSLKKLLELGELVLMVCNEKHSESIDGDDKGVLGDG